jgi:hypothetical protein
MHKRDGKQYNEIEVESKVLHLVSNNYERFCFEEMIFLRQNLYKGANIEA